MPDIELRFNRDMLVLSAAPDTMLAQQGVDVERDREYLNLMEPDVMADVLRLEMTAGAQCLVTSTEDITRARLAHVGMDDDAPRLARAALDIAAGLKPQHVLAQIGPCGLPLDASSKSSLNENRAQYADAARAFGEGGYDAFFLNGFTRIDDLKCALMGVAQVSGVPVFASVVTSAREPERREHLISRHLAEAADVMAEYGASVIGFETSDQIDLAVEYARTMARGGLPLLAQLRVTAKPSAAVAKGLVPVSDIKEYTVDTLEHAAVKLYASGVQFLRAAGAATPACTGALVATVQGLDVRLAQLGSR